MYDLQKANMWKRISASLFDTILLGIAAVGLSLLLSVLLGYDSYSDRLQMHYDSYESRYGISFDITPEEYEAFSEDELAVYDAAAKDFSQNTEVSYLYGMMLNLTLIIVAFSILLAYLIFEFLIPILLANGQTLGKKVFGIGVMRVDGVKLSSVLLFARTVLGKYTVETMIPVLLCIMIYFGYAGPGGLLVIGILILAQIILLAVTSTRATIHDKLAHTVVVDLASQLIFDTPEALLEYKKRTQKKQAQQSDY